VSQYDRDADPVEFSRMVTLTDGVFAIALTLLVLDLALPAQAGDVSLATALGDMAPRFFAFAISVAVVGTFFQSHHELLSMLQKIDGGLLGLTIPYLGFIALIPFVQGVMSDRPDEPLAFAIYGFVLGCASAIGAAMLWRAHRRGLLREPLVGRTAWFEALRSALPVGVFFASAGVAFLIGEWAVLFWVSLWPLDAILARLQRRGT
jgi:uncharacterized membrane protein